jgi:hypothetical protein
MNNVAVKTDEGVDIGLAATREDLRAAYRLVYEQYRLRGYTDEDPGAVRVTLWNALPGSHTVVARRAGRGVGTVTYIQDSDAGLPTDDMAQGALNMLRAGRRRLVEVSGLSVDDGRDDSATVMAMFQYGLVMCMAFLDATDYVITVNPRHVPFYERILRFEQIGTTQSYHKVKGAPGVPMRLNLVTLEETYHRRYGQRQGSRNLHAYFFGEKPIGLMPQIARDLAEREGLLSRSFLRAFYVDKTRAVRTPEDLQVFRRQWAEWRSVREPSAAVAV